MGKQAAFRSAFQKQTITLNQVGRKIGSYFKGCQNCGSYDVYKSYRPKVTKWIYWCYTCGAKDDECW